MISREKTREVRIAEAMAVGMATARITPEGHGVHTSHRARVIEGVA